jgi:hypothetical protein
VTARRALVGVVIAAVAVGCWWMLHSTPTPATPPDAATRSAKHEPPPRRVARPAPTRDPAPDDPSHPWRVVVRVVRANDQTPVADADVDLDLGERDDFHRSARTDAAGVARFAAESGPGHIRVLVCAPGFVRSYRGLFEQIEVKKGVATDVAVELDAACAMEGVVLEEDGRPLAGARLIVDGGFMHFDVEPPVAQTTSDKDGRFRLEGLDRRVASRVRASAERHAWTALNWNPADAKPVEIRLSTGARIVGVVTDAFGAPVAGATVRAWTTNAGRVDVDLLPTEPQTTTDAAGRYAVECLPFGATWSVQASKSGFGDSDFAQGLAPDAAQREVARDLVLKVVGRVDLSIVTADGTRIVAADVVVETAAGRTQTRAARTDPPFAIDVREFPACSIGVDARGFPPKSVDLSIAPGERRKIEIRLDRDAPVAGVVVDDLGRPIVGAKVATLVRDAWKFGPVDRSAVSETDGAFRIGGITSGRYGLNASAEGHEAVYGVEAWAPSDGLRIVLRRTGTLSLSVRAPTGVARPAQITVAVRRPDTPSKSLYTFDWTDAPIVLPVDPGPWRVEIAADGFHTATRAADVAPGAESSVGVVVFGDRVAFTGHVVDARGRGVAGARVVVGDGASFEAGAEGWFCVTHLPRGRCRVVVTARDGRPIAERDVELRAGDDAPVEFVAEK